MFKVSWKARVGTRYSGILVYALDAKQVPNRRLPRRLETSPRNLSRKKNATYPEAAKSNIT